jgi:Tfp pilus assembly protein PilV
MNPADRSDPAADGMTLIDVLAALVIVSVGMLAVLGLLSRSMALRSLDLQQASAGRLVADAGELVAILEPTRLRGLAHGPAGPPCSPCDAQQFAQLAYDSWRRRVAATLPAGVGTVTTSGAMGSPLVVEAEVAWRDGRDRPRAVQRRFVKATLP